MTAVAVDPVEALAEVLWKSWRPDPHIAVHDWSEIPEMMREPFRNMARAALAHARGLVPGEEFCHDGVCGNTDQCSYHEARSAFRAETLRRLGGEGTT